MKNPVEWTNCEKSANSDGNTGFLFNTMPILGYVENTSRYVWSRPVTRMVLEVQCLAVALIVTSQVWILSYYGTEMFESLIGNDILLPLLYLVAIIIGTLTYVRPTYWRIATSLTAYCTCVYFSVLVTTFELRALVTPTLTDLFQNQPENAGVWIPWAIGFAFHMHISVTSTIISFISVRDMYYFDPVALDKKNTVVRDGLIYPKDLRINFVQEDVQSDSGNET